MVRADQSLPRSSAFWNRSEVKTYGEASSPSCSRYIPALGAGLSAHLNRALLPVVLLCGSDTLLRA